MEIYFPQLQLYTQNMLTQVFFITKHWTWILEVPRGPLTFVSVCRTLMMLQLIQNPKQKCCQTGARKSLPWAVRQVFCWDQLPWLCINGEPRVQKVCAGHFLSCAITHSSLCTGYLQDQSKAPQCLAHFEVNLNTDFKCLLPFLFPSYFIIPPSLCNRKQLETPTHLFDLFASLKSKSCCFHNNTINFSSFIFSTLWLNYELSL